MKTITKIEKFIIILAFIIISISGNKIYAVPAFPNLITITQSDSSLLQVYIKGDERLHWFESPEQFTLLRNEEGYLTYAIKNANNDLIPSKHRYWNDNTKIKQTQERTNFINNLKPKFFFSEKQINNFINDKKPDIINNLDNFNKKSNDKNTEKLQAYYPHLIEGTRKYLVVLMSYPDLPFTKTREDFEKLFNEVNYQGNNNGSVKDFYMQNSYGKFTPEFVVVGPFKTNYTMDYYKENSRVLAEEAAMGALEQLMETGVSNNLNDFDNDFDGYVDAVNIIFSGWGEEAGFSKGIWSHASQIVDNNGYSPMIGGKYIRRYCCSPELSGNNGNRISSIGVQTHEFCHTLGAPDYYDVNYEINGSYSGAGEWCLMANGSWNAGGNCPAGINIFQKWLYGWIEPIMLETEDVKVNNMPNSAHNPVTYRINTDTEDEFYIMENRQQTGFDKYVPGHGLIIWHVHADMATNLLYGYNDGNSTHPQAVYPVCAASQFAIPTQSANSYGNISSQGTPFPGSSNNSEFTDKSIPSACSWNGKKINRPIKNITEIDSFISFGYTGRPNSIFTIPYSYNFDFTSHFDYYKVVNEEDSDIKWTREGNNNSYIMKLRSFYNADTSHKEHFLFLPPFQLYRNYLYLFAVDYKVYSSIYPGNMKLWLCNSSDINDKILIKNFGEQLDKTTSTKLSADFSVNEESIYYLAISSYTKGDYMDMYLDNIDIKANVNIDENNENDMKILPNPVESNIYIISTENEKINNIEIFNLEGKNVLTTNDININLSNLNSGTYLIKIVTDNRTVFDYIIKK